MVARFPDGGHGQQKLVSASGPFFKRIEDVVPLLVAPGYTQHIQVDGSIQQNDCAHVVAPERIFFSHSSVCCLRASPVL